MTACNAVPVNVEREIVSVFDSGVPSTTLIPPTDRAPYTDLCVSDGWGWGCALDMDHLPECFGDLTVIDGVPIPTDTPLTDLTCGAQQACGLAADGRILCWGNNDYGQTDVPLH